MPALVLSPTPLEDALLERKLVDPTEICDRLKVMRQQESTTYRVFDYLAKHAELLKRVNKPIDEDCRVKMCEWCYQVSVTKKGTYLCALLLLDELTLPLPFIRLWTFASFVEKPSRLACLIWTDISAVVLVAVPWPIARNIS